MAVKRFFFRIREDGGPSIEREEDADGDYIEASEFDKLFEIIKDLSLCVDDYGESIGTHYIANTHPIPKVMPKGSFIALVERAKAIVNEEEK